MSGTEVSTSYFKVFIRVFGFHDRNLLQQAKVEYRMQLALVKTNHIYFCSICVSVYGLREFFFLIIISHEENNCLRPLTLQIKMIFDFAFREYHKEPLSNSNQLIICINLDIICLYKEISRNEKFINFRYFIIVRHPYC